MVPIRLESFLPGELILGRGTPRDYVAMERFHYRAGRPATWAGVWVVRYRAATGDVPHSGTYEGAVGVQGRLVAVAVLSYPCVNSAARDRALGMGRWSGARKLALANREVRTISRVVVHPQFRGVGLASRLVSAILEQCPTRWVEAYAVMGRVHPFFEKGGMKRYDPPGGEGPVYYLFERSE